MDKCFCKESNISWDDTSEDIYAQMAEAYLSLNSMKCGTVRI